MNKKYSYLFLSGLLLSACGGSETNSFKQTPKGVEVSVKNVSENTPKIVRLEVFGDKIIRVSATKDDKFKDPQSLVIVDQKSQPAFKVEQNGDTVKVITNALKANVLTSSGKVFFTDLSGKVILSEADNGTTLTPYQVTQTTPTANPKLSTAGRIRRFLIRPTTRLFTVSVSTRRTTGTTKAKTRNFFNTTQKSLCRLWFRLKITALCSIRIH